jgi:hypothetical protein
MDWNTVNFNIADINIGGRNYKLHLNDVRVVSGGTIVRITGTRKADGAVMFRNEGQYEGRAQVVGISHLERLNWWDISRAVAPYFPIVNATLNGGY